MIKSFEFDFFIHLAHFEQLVSVQNDEIFSNICHNFQKVFLQVENNICSIFNLIECDT
jgi:hypothetical protein